MGVGGAIGAGVASRMAITELPQMVAGFHSLVGLAAVTTSIASYIAHPELMDPTHLTSTFLGAFIGAVTLTGASCSIELFSYSKRPAAKHRPQHSGLWRFAALYSRFYPNE